MSAQNILQPLNCNVESPKRKRPRLESKSTCKSNAQTWSFSFQEKPEEMLCEMGVQMLEYEPEEDCKEVDESCKFDGPDLAENETNPDLIDSSENKHPSSRTCNGSDSGMKDSINSESSSRCSYHSKPNSVEKNAKEWSQFTVTKRSKGMIENANFDYFEMLSDEMVLSIFRWLPKVMLARLATVCQRWNRLSQDESLWTRMDVSNRFLEPGALGSIMSRQCVALRLAQAEISAPAIKPNVKFSNPEFRSRLLYLDLSMAQISVSCLNTLLGKCTKLRKISLEAVRVDEEICQHLSRNKDLEVLNFCMTEGLGLIGLSSIFKNCSKLRELNIGWTYLDANTVKSICKMLPKTLDRLNISGCRKTLKDDNIADIVRRCPDLREFDLSDCTTLTEKSIVFIRLLQELNFLSLSRCYMIPYNALLSLRTVPSLMYLDVHGGHISHLEISTMQTNTKVQINKFTFSSIARPTVGARRSSIWGLRVRD